MGPDWAPFYLAVGEALIRTLRSTRRAAPQDAAAQRRRPEGVSRRRITSRLGRRRTLSPGDNGPKGEATAWPSHPSLQLASMMGVLYAPFYLAVGEALIRTLRSTRRVALPGVQVCFRFLHAGPIPVLRSASPVTLPFPVCAGCRTDRMTRVAWPGPPWFPYARRAVAWRHCR